MTCGAPRKHTLLGGREHHPCSAVGSSRQDDERCARRVSAIRQRLGRRWHLGPGVDELPLGWQFFGVRRTGPSRRMPRSSARISSQLTATAQTAIGADHAVGYPCKTAKRCLSTSDDVTESVVRLSTSKRIIDSTTAQNSSDITAIRGHHSILDGRTPSYSGDTP
jgi:hypothetical protein